MGPSPLANARRGLSGRRSMSRKREAGQSLITVAICLVFLLAMMGFGIDIGILRYEKRIQQTAADAAAIAAADDLAHECLGDYSGCTDWQTAAQNAATNLGFANGTNNVTVTVNVPPTSGPHASGTSSTDYVEVIISAVHPTFFERIVGANQATVVARAVATYYYGSGPTSSNCLYTLGTPTNEIGVDAQGSATINATTCGIVDNGNFDPTGNGITINSCSFNVSGDPASGPGANNVYCNSKSESPTYNQPTAPNPLLSLDNQTPCDLGYVCDPNSSPNAPNTSGCSGGATYCCPSGVTVCSFKSVSINSNVTFAPGVYIVDGGGTTSNPGFNCTGSPTVQGTGVMFFFTGQATITCTGSVTVDLTAPTDLSGSLAVYNGMLLWQDPADTSTGNLSAKGNSCTSNSTLGPRLGGNTSATYGGIVYFPADQLWFFGNNKGNLDASVDAAVSDSLCTSGNVTLNVQGTTGLGSGPINSVLSNAVLVE